jgi:hypothetical protein
MVMSTDQKPCVVCVTVVPTVFIVLRYEIKHIISIPEKGKNANFRMDFGRLALRMPEN